MRNLVVVTLLLLASLATAELTMNLSYWLLPPPQKFARAWREDLDLLEKTNHFPKAWKSIKAIQFRSNESFVEDWYNKGTVPFETHKDGKYNLQILALHQIHNNRYGVMLQYNWVDLETGNTVGEMGRTIKLGIVY